MVLSRKEVYFEMELATLKVIIHAAFESPKTANYTSSFRCKSRSFLLMDLSPVGASLDTNGIIHYSWFSDFGPKRFSQFF